ncbi:polysaccharide deacetylase family protein [Prauserella flavalba]|uniref:NodB homology domain-containing protein n=1 Tax=Prauserella flavalba TaxID=1477506 RepID=A0A318LQA5_9PSEU|nr:polysaccharide deacetylase family protein [Prauserella flavalba]PXY36696.1 hypothetical protein BA062_15170 [Prauserella flavalba]
MARQRIWGAGGVLAAVALLVGTLAPGAAANDVAPASARVFTRAYDTSTKVVTLTFDADWWSPGDPATVLRILRDNGITAGFGLTGRYVDRYPDRARQLLAAGHKLINHSYDHPYFTDLTQAQRWSQLDRAEAVYNRIGYTSAGWFRAPYRDGYLNAGVNRDLALRGYYLSYDWTFDTTGYQGASTATILSRVRQYTVPGATIVMHLSNESTDTAALPQIISTLRGMGYGFTSPYRSVTRGAIGAKYAALGARNSVLGAPRTGETSATAGGAGAVQWFQHGRIYWNSAIGAREVHGAIMSKYAGLGTVNGFLGFPRTDERRCPDGIGRYGQFQGGSAYWSPSTGAHEVHGAILTRWASLGWERSRLGYPVSDEYAVSGGRRSDFQGGAIIWTAATGTTRVIYA